MIIYGSRNKELAKEHIFDKCPNCGTQNSIDMHVFQKYAHVFWIPFFPLGKTGSSQCSHCKQMLQLKKMPLSLKTAYENLRSQTRVPIWTFAGLALIAALIIIGIISDKNKSEKNARLILTPQSGDLFKVKTGNNQYTLYKVDQVKNDSVFIRFNNYEIDKASALYRLKNKGYSSEIYVFSKTELQKMLQNGGIIDIDRQ